MIPIFPFMRRIVAVVVMREVLILEFLGIRTQE